MAWQTNPALGSQGHSCQLRPTSVGCSHHGEELWQPSLWQMFLGDRSSARGSGWPLPPCRSPPAGCPAAALPARRSRRARHPPRCPRSWHGSQAVPARSFSVSSPLIRSPWTQTRQGNKRYDFTHKVISGRHGTKKIVQARLFLNTLLEAEQRLSYFSFTNSHSSGQKEHTCWIQELNIVTEVTRKPLRPTGSWQQRVTVFCHSLCP